MSAGFFIYAGYTGFFTYLLGTYQSTFKMALSNVNLEFNFVNFLTILPIYLFLSYSLSRDFCSMVSLIEVEFGKLNF